MPKSLSTFIGHPNFNKWLVVSIIACLLGFGLITSLSGILAPFICGFIGAYLFNKLACRLERYIPRSIAAGILILTFVVLLRLI